MKNKAVKSIIVITMLLVFTLCLAVPCFAAGTGDVAGAVEKTWEATRGQIKQIVNNVIFPIVDLVLAVLFFVKVATAYMDYRKHGQVEWTAPAILLATLVFSLTCPLYIWSILGI